MLSNIEILLSQDKICRIGLGTNLNTQMLSSLWELLNIVFL